ncbi:MAG: hypothetical protein PHY15_02000 [Eubacteriales bacterium]|nr:hypothetical protein [Eubacteriales bacterium]MDD4475621.1 hypothetical protein [Eubacteriales bacterium]
MNNFDARIKKIKEKLYALSSPESELKKLYRKAIDKSRAEFESGIKKAESKAFDKTNSESALSLLGKKNSGIKAEKDGTLEAGVNYALEEARLQKLKETENEISRKTELEKENLLDKHTEEKAVLAEQLTKSEDKARTSLEKELSEVEKQKAKAAEEAAKNAVKAAEDAKKSEEKQKSEEKYKPTVTAKEFAKNLIERFSGDSEKIKVYVAEISKQYNFDSVYLKDLLFALEAYTKPQADKTEKLTDKEVNELLEGGEKAFKETYSKVYKTFSDLGEGGLELSKKAVRMGKEAQMDFFYRSSATMEQFESLCKKAELTDAEIKSHADRVAFINGSTDGKLELGEYIVR